MKKYLSLKSILLTINLLVISCVLILNYFYQKAGFDFTLKCICSAGFALLGIVNLCYALWTRQVNMSFYIGMASGLVLAMLGDIILKYSFIFGAGVFALGHVCFFVSYCFLEKIKRLDLIISGVIFSLSAIFLLFFPLLTFEAPIFRVVCIIYALIISLMLGKAISLFISKRTYASAIIATASALFFFSDLMLVLDWFVGRWSWTDHACMGTYYPALCMLAFSMLVKSLFKKNTNE